jgi:hypothetical protein
MKKLIFFIILFMACALPAMAQTDCADQLAQCSQMANKALVTVEAQRMAMDAQQKEIAAKDKVILTQSDLIDKQKSIIAEQAEVIKMLEKRTRRKVSIFFGLIKITY